MADVTYSSTFKS